MRHLRLLLLFACVLGAACGGSGGGEGRAVDLNGWWEFGTRAPGSGGAYDLQMYVPLAHSGTTVVFENVPLTLDGSSLHGVDPDLGAGRQREYVLAVVSPDHLEGTWTTYAEGGPIGGLEFRLLRAPTPAGTLTVEGRAGGDPVAVTCTTAYAIAQSAPAAEVYTLIILDTRPEGARALRFTFERPPPLPAGTYDVTHEAGAALQQDTTYFGAADGQVTLSRVTPDHVTGSYRLTLAGAETIAGTFDARIWITR